MDRFFQWMRTKRVPRKFYFVIKLLFEGGFRALYQRASRLANYHSNLFDAMGYIRIRGQGQIIKNVGILLSHIQGQEKLSEKQFFNQISLNTHEANQLENLIFNIEPIRDVLVGYLGDHFKLASCQVVHSIFVENKEPSSSQLWHLDSVSDRQVKLILNLSKVEQSDGPFRWLNRHVSRQVIKGLGREWGRIKDNEIAPFNLADEVETLLGKDSVVLINSSQCLHHGSRVTKGGARKVLMMNWVENWLVV